MEKKRLSNIDQNLYRERQMTQIREIYVEDQDPRFPDDLPWERDSIGRRDGGVGGEVFVWGWTERVVSIGPESRP